jgi:ubiquinol-cytochrome c reductase iron-sulfur subunit
MAEWLIVSPVNTGGIGCLVIPNAELHDGFYDSCQNVHFDMWGRVMSGPTDKNLIVVPATYVNDKAKIIFDLSNLPEMERP